MVSEIYSSIKRFFKPRLKTQKCSLLYHRVTSVLEHVLHPNIFLLRGHYEFYQENKSNESNYGSMLLWSMY